VVVDRNVIIDLRDLDLLDEGAVLLIEEASDVRNLFAEIFELLASYRPECISIEDLQDEFLLHRLFIDSLLLLRSDRLLRHLDGF